MPPACGDLLATASAPSASERYLIATGQPSSAEAAGHGGADPARAAGDERASLRPVFDSALTAGLPLDDVAPHVSPAPKAARGPVAAVRIAPASAASQRAIGIEAAEVLPKREWSRQRARVEAEAARERGEDPRVRLVEDEQVDVVDLHAGCVRASRLACDMRDRRPRGRCRGPACG